MKMKTPHLIAATLFCALHSAMPQAADVQPPNANNNVYFGDVHVHTSWSFDAYVFGNTLAGPALPTAPKLRRWMPTPGRRAS